MLALIAVLVAAYLLGAVPFGYLVARAKGVDLFQAGSGNIGATNVGRVLGRKYGVLVFVLDFLKGALPVVAALPVVKLLGGEEVVSPNVLAVCAGLAAFVGHLFPVYLKFRGGKGVATGAGVVAMLAPMPFLAALLTWILTVLVSRMVSLASILAVLVLTACQLAMAQLELNSVTGFCVVAMLFVIGRHASNISRIVRGTENQIGDGPMRQNLLRVLHIVAVGIWVGGAGFFNFVTATTLNATFANVVATSPSDRTAHMQIVPPGATPEMKKSLGSALFGAAVGPIFPKYFAMQLACSFLVMGTAWVWRNAEPPTKRHRARFLLSLMALVSLLVGWWISEVVSRLRVSRLDLNPDVAAVANAQFATWHFVSLALSIVTILLAFAILVLAAWLPQRQESKVEPGLPAA